MTNLDHAELYVALGWHVVPIFSITTSGACTCGQDCGRDRGKHPRMQSGAQAATRDLGVIYEWWIRWPDASVGIATGWRSDIVVLDVDADSSGLQSLQDLESKHGPLPQGPRVTTGGGGVHYYFALPRGTTISSSASDVAIGIDVLGEGGYVVAPPSLHHTGKSYFWGDGESVDTLYRTLFKDALPEPPTWLLELMKWPPGLEWTETPQGTVRFDGPLAVPLLTNGRIPAEKRKGVLLAMASTMRRHGVPGEEFIGRLHAANQRWCDPPLPIADVRGMAEYVVALMAPPPEVLLLEKTKRRLFSQLGEAPWWRFWERS